MFAVFRAGSVPQCYVETRWRSYLVSINRRQIMTQNVLSLDIWLKEEKRWKCESMSSVLVA